MIQKITKKTLIFRRGKYIFSPCFFISYQQPKRLLMFLMLLKAFKLLVSRLYKEPQSTYDDKFLPL
jgi:hypothetical protein